MQSLLARPERGRKAIFQNGPQPSWSTMSDRLFLILKGYEPPTLPFRNGAVDEIRTRIHQKKTLSKQHGAAGGTKSMAG
ncbi:hypothetical protein G6M78_05050 [Agrobacterium tumefaciens]|uniref:hypothetical protein n=1 Tax=Agrobacterium tumefaciens TaxID=358 RepID=UPI0015719742|nr:hypothetical protein [Agrobacterium tumefaciens]NTE54442.1 hypothetical protein [Agrobacterium tumefaciens]NTE73290.1 hypothetical protein [Agrobacterium tumefaciens]